MTLDLTLETDPETGMSILVFTKDKTAIRIPTGNRYLPPDAVRTYQFIVSNALTEIKASGRGRKITHSEPPLDNPTAPFDVYFVNGTYTEGTFDLEFVRQQYISVERRKFFFKKIKENKPVGDPQILGRVSIEENEWHYL